MNRTINQLVARSGLLYESRISTAGIKSQTPKREEKKKG